MDKGGSYGHVNPVPGIADVPDTAVISGTVHNDILRGDDRDNIFLSSDGRDYIEGGRGLDTVSYSGRPESIRVVLDSSSVSLVYMEDHAATQIVNGRALNAQSTSLGAGTTTTDHDPTPEAPPVPTVVYTHKDVLRDIEGLVGGNSADWLVGNSHDNMLVGGPGSDILAGGKGADHFIYWNDPPQTSEGIDAVLDFDGSAGDRFDFSKISEDIGTDLTFSGTVASYDSPVPYSVFYKKSIDPRDNPFSEGCPFKDKNGEPFFKEQDGLSLMMDRDGDAHADFMIAVWGSDHITASDLIL